MKNISVLLEKFKEITNHSSAVRDIIKEVLEKDFSVKVKKNQIILKGQTAFVKVSGVAKAEIATQEKKIIEKINHLSGKSSVAKIN